MRTDVILNHIHASIKALDGDLGRRGLTVVQQIQRQAKLMDEIERDVEEVTDEHLRRRLRRVIERYDAARDDIESEVNGILTYDLFDPLRILARDLRTEQTQNQ